jgi:uncharacterized protein
MSKHKLKILAIDGGGIKGIIPCTILKYIETKTGLPTSRLFHVLAGTSTGGIISLGLSKPDEDGNNAYTADDMLKLYVENGKNIFGKRPKDFKSWLGSIIEKGLFDKNFDVTKFEEILKEKFGDSKLKESLTGVLVTTYAPEQEKPFYFSSRLALEDEKENIPLREIARSTSAAPTYFKPSQVTYDKNQQLAFVDGGVFANNPSILAYSEAKEIWKKQNRTITVNIPEGVDKNTKTFEAVVSADDNDLPFFLLSLSCGHSSARIDFSEADEWRAKDWIKPLLTNIFMQSVAESTDYTMKYLLPPFVDGTPRYVRFDLAIPEENSQMDDASDENIKQLCAIADDFVAKNKAELDKVCALLLK